MKTYTGYIYLWLDTRSGFFYLGGHHGTLEDSYICSNTIMKRAYKKRPDTFRFRVLEYVNGTPKDLRIAEQRWLNMIDASELMTTNNVYAGTCRYYNVKKNAVGGNGSANRGNSNIGGHNKGKPMSKDQKAKISASLRGRTHKRYSCIYCRKNLSVNAINVHKCK